MAKYKLIACHVLWREFCHYAARSENVLDLAFLEQGLHDTPELLRTKLQTAIDGVEDGYSAILIGYGLCSRGIDGLRARKTRLVIPRGHDCITLLLGSKERYREYFDAHPGTYWYSPGWIDDTIMPGKERYERLRKQYVEQYGEENADYLMQTEQQWYTHYSNAAFVTVGVGDTERYRRFTEDCASWLGWRADNVPGGSRLFEDLLEGRWQPQDFLVVEPGEMVAVSYDELIIKAVPAPAE